MLLVSILAGVGAGMLTALFLHGLLAWVDALAEMDMMDWDADP